LEVAGDPFRGDDGLDPIDRRGVTGRGEPSAFLSVEPLEDVVAVVQCVREVGGGPAGLPATDRAILEDDDPPAFEGQQVGRRDAGDAGADDGDAGPQVPREGGRARGGAVAIQSESVRPVSLRMAWVSSWNHYPSWEEQGRNSVIRAGLQQVERRIRQILSGKAVQR
jgi:hypothetical protein